MNPNGVIIVAALGLLVFGVSSTCQTRSAPADNLTQREVTLGDGTKATCIIVRDAGVTCVPHVVLGPDAEDDKP